MARSLSRVIAAACIPVAVALLVQTSCAREIGRTGRYFTDTRGKPMFLLGYYDWASVAGDHYIDQPSVYRDMIDRMSKCKLNYVRVSLGINRFSDATEPSSHDSRPTPVAFRYVNGKADLEAWDERFWGGLRELCDHARSRGVFVHVCFFDGVGLRGGREIYRWVGSPWNGANQIRDFHGDVDVGHDGGTDQSGDFYRVEDFRNDAGIGYFQRRLIAKVIAETAKYDNVFYEIGNELLGSSAEWNAAVVTYAKSLTTKLVTQNGGGPADNADGLSDHGGDTPKSVRGRIAKMRSAARPVWIDPDGSALLDGTADELRHAAWYSLVDGAAGWGGFTQDYWSGGRYDAEKAAYYSSLASFVRQSGLRFWEMTPDSGLVSNPDENGCMAKAGTEYVAYVLNDTEVTLDLSALNGKASVRLYDPKAGKWLSLSAHGGEPCKLHKPAGADDWVICVRSDRQGR